jgi:hypothetical protein
VNTNALRSLVMLIISTAVAGCGWRSNEPAGDSEPGIHRAGLAYPPYLRISELETDVDRNLDRLAAAAHAEGRPIDWGLVGVFVLDIGLAALLVVMWLWRPVGVDALNGFGGR